jgi:hypothetical protein
MGGGRKGDGRYANTMDGGRWTKTISDFQRPRPPSADNLCGRDNERFSPPLDGQGRKGNV